MAPLPMKKQEEEFLQAYKDYSGALFRYCFFKIHNRDLAKDLLQETFTRTWGYIARGGTVNNMKSFLYKTLNNLVIENLFVPKDTLEA